MSTLDIIEQLAPEFSNVPQDDIQAWVEMLSPLVSKKRFGKLYDLALAYLVCHKLKISGKGTSATNGLGNLSDSFGISSISDGGTSISFNSGAVGSLTMDAEYALTSYGTQYLQLRRSLIIPCVVAGENEVHYV